MTLIELIAALALFVIILGSLLTVMNTATSLWSSSRSQNRERATAENLAGLVFDDLYEAVADNGVAHDPHPLIEVGQATFLVGSDLPGVMTWNSKVAYGSTAAAQVAQQVHGGRLLDFQQTLRVSFADLADDLERMRKGREERRKRAARKG